MEKIKKKINSTKLEKWYLTFCIALIIYIRFHYYWNSILGNVAIDSTGYIDYSFSINTWGYRPPIYPLIIRLFRCIFGEKNYLLLVSCLQILFSSFAVYLVYKASYLVSKNKYISGIIMVAYGCNPCILYYDTMILSESLAISVSAIFLYRIVKYVNTVSTKDGLLTVLISLIATGIKVTLAVYTGVILVLLIMQFFLLSEYRKRIWRVGLMTVAVVSLYLIYSYIGWINYGTFNLTNLGPRHSLVPCLETDSYKNYPDKEIVKQVDRVYNERRATGEYLRDYSTTTPIMGLFGNSFREQNIKVSEFTSYCIRTDIKGYMNYLIDNIKNWRQREYTSSDIECNSVLSEKTWEIQDRIFSRIKMKTGFRVMFISMFMSVFLWVYQKKCPWYWIGTAGAIFAIEASVFLGSYDDFIRLTVYVLPFIYFGIALILDLFLKCIKKIQNRIV